ncbi:MAG: hypothetical protein H0T21_09305 [Gemmatimonadaceae bacterium]|nr:hypothetical protein [Gemmatimonadaceae bacterium]
MRLTQNPPAAAAAGTREELQNAVRDIRQSVKDQVAAAKAEAPTAQGPTPPGPPSLPDGGRITVVGSPDFPFGAGGQISREASDFAIIFVAMVAAVLVLLPVTRAWARRIDPDRKGGAQIPADLSAQIAQLNQSVDAIALEVERISEGQRFTTRLLSEQRAEAGRPMLTGGEKKNPL